MVSHLLEILPAQLGLAYDIGCSFTTTLMKSSLGQKAQDLGLRLVVPAFHGHAHNRLCQLDFHIQVSTGFGLEDLETCEHVFSGSNAVAQLTRHATPFHRRQYINMHFRQWDANKYENLGQFLLNYYKQALGVMEEMPVRIQTLTSSQQITESQFTSWLNSEHDYLRSKQLEPEVDILGMEYVELLDKYNDAR